MQPIGTFKVAFFSVVSSKVDDSILGGVGLSEVTDAKPLQPENADPPMDVTLLGMVNDTKLLQPENAELPMDVTLLGISMDVRPEQP